MRVKLTAKHPRPASPSRAPVRPTSPSARKTPRAAPADRPAPADQTAAPRSGAKAAGPKRGGDAVRAPRARTAERRTEDTPRGAPRVRATEHRREDTPRAAPRQDKPRDARTARDESERKPRAATRADKPRDARTARDESERKPRATNRAGGSDRPGAGPTGRSRGATNERFARGERPARSTEGRSAREPSANAAGERKVARPVKQGFAPSSAAPERRRDAPLSRPSPSAKAGDRERRATSDGRARPAARTRADAASTGKARPSRVAGPVKAAPTSSTTRATPQSRASSDEGLVRLSKRMSELGLCSRREADEWIENGWVRVDGERIDTLGTRVRPDQHIEVTRDAQAAQSRQVTILLHKPVGYVSGQAEDGYEPAITLITAANRWEGDRATTRFVPSQLRALAPAGRLDIDSTGLLVLTQDGRIAKQLIGEHSSVEKEYLVRVTYGERTTDIAEHFPADKLALLRFGLSLDGAALKPAKVSWQNGEQLRFVLREGKKRQIRRMCELVGLQVVGLKRVRMGSVALGALPQGKWRYLLPNEAF
jgi:23S rRNA pseudouridine2604 synthase